MEGLGFCARVIAIRDTGLDSGMEAPNKPCACMRAASLILMVLSRRLHACRHMSASEQLIVRIENMDVCCTRCCHMLHVFWDETVIRAVIGVNSPMIDSLA